MNIESITGKPISLAECKECKNKPAINYDPPATVVFRDHCGIFVGDENEPLRAFDYWNLLNIIGKIKVTLTGPDKEFLIKRLP